TASSLAAAAEAGAYLTGALDIVESTFALLRSAAPQAASDSRRTGTGDADVDERHDEQDDTRGEELAALVRRAGELRTELRFLMRASDDEYVYFVEFRGRGTFLRASPIDVSRIIRDLLIDRMRTTVLTSATLTVDGSFDYIRDRLGIVHADAVRLP